jgi:hypothetical protein
VTRALLAKYRERGPADIHCAPEVHIDLPGELLRRLFLKGAHDAIAGIVHDYIESSKRLHSLLYDSPCVFGSGYVERRCPYLLTELGRQSLKVACVASGRDYQFTPLQQALYNGSPQASLTSRHHPNFPVRHVAFSSDI